MRFRLVAFADEAAPDLAGQIEAMQENGVELLEIRGVDGQNIDGISATKATINQRDRQQEKSRRRSRDMEI